MIVSLLRLIFKCSFVKPLLYIFLKTAMQNSLWSLTLKKLPTYFKIFYGEEWQFKWNFTKFNKLREINVIVEEINILQMNALITKSFWLFTE